MALRFRLGTPAVAAAPGEASTAVLGSRAVRRVLTASAGALAGRLCRGPADDAGAAGAGLCAEMDGGGGLDFKQLAKWQCLAAMRKKARRHHDRGPAGRTHAERRGGRGRHARRHRRRAKPAKSGGGLFGGGNLPLIMMMAGAGGGKPQAAPAPAPPLAVRPPVAVAPPPPPGETYFTPPTHSMPPSSAAQNDPKAAAANGSVPSPTGITVLASGQKVASLSTPAGSRSAVAHFSIDFLPKDGEKSDTAATNAPLSGNSSGDERPEGREGPHSQSPVGGNAEFRAEDRVCEAVGKFFESNVGVGGELRLGGSFLWRMAEIAGAPRAVFDALKKREVKLVATLVSKAPDGSRIFTVSLDGLPEVECAPPAVDGRSAVPHVTGSHSTTALDWFTVFHVIMALRRVLQAYGLAEDVILCPALAFDAPLDFMNDAAAALNSLEYNFLNEREAAGNVSVRKLALARTVLGGSAFAKILRNPEEARKTCTPQMAKCITGLLCLAAAGSADPAADRGEFLDAFSAPRTVFQAADVQRAFWAIALRENVVHIFDDATDIFESKFAVTDDVIGRGLSASSLIHECQPFVRIVHSGGGRHGDSVRAKFIGLRRKPNGEVSSVQYKVSKEDFCKMQAYVQGNN